MQADRHHGEGRRTIGRVGRLGVRRRGFLGQLGLVALLLASACAPASAPSSAPAGKAAEPAKAATGDKVVWKLGHGAAEPAMLHRVWVDVKTLIESANSKAELQIFPAEQLGGDPVLLQSTKLGTVEMTSVPPAIVGTLERTKPYLAITLPFMFKDYDVANKVLADPQLLQRFDELADQEGLTVLGWWPMGPLTMTANKPIRTIDDMKGLKIRSSPNPIQVSIYKSWGANPTPIPFGETYLALQQRTVEASATWPTLIISNKWYEVQKYAVPVDHSLDFHVVVANKRWLAGLPADVQQAIKDGVKQGEEISRTMLDQETTQAFEDMKKNGMEVIEYDDRGKEPFRTASEVVYGEFEGQIGKDFLDGFRKRVKELGG